MLEKEFFVETSEFYTRTKEATARIKDYIQQTPLELSASLSQGNNCQVYLKMEHLQTSGSFKIRGAANMILSLTKAEKKEELSLHQAAIMLRPWSICSKKRGLE